jgi:two-component system, LytTR family, response regulator
MYSAVIIDDEEDGIHVLVQFLSEFTTVKVKVAGTATNLDEGIQIIRNTNPEIVFLDIDMPGKNGMAIYNYFNEPAFKIIFVTAYKQYAIDALNHSASGYLLKPISFIDLQELLVKVTKELNQEQQQRELDDRINLLSSAEMTGKNIILDVENGFIMENTRNIEYCYANQSYSVVVLHTKKEIVVTKPLKSLQELLPPNQFYRTHKSYLVNVFYIRKFFRGNESYVILKSGAKIAVSVRTSAIISNDIKKMLLL